MSEPRDNLPAPVRPGAYEQEMEANASASASHDTLPQELHRLLRGRYVWAVVLGVLGAVGGAVGGWWMAGPPMYRSTGLIRIAPVLPRVLYKNELNDMLPMFQSFVNAQTTLITSRRVVSMAMRSDRWQKVGGQTSRQALSHFSANLQANHPDGSEIINVGFSDEDPAVAQAGLKSVLDAYKTIYGERNVRGEAQRLKILDKRRTALTSELKSLRDRVMQIANQYGSDALEQTYHAKAQQMQKVEAQLKQVRLALAQRTGHSHESGTLSHEQQLQHIADNDSRMRSYLTRRDNLEDQISQQSSTLGPQHPMMRRLNHALAQLNKRIEQYADQYQADPAAQAGASDVLSTEDLRQREKQLSQLRDQTKAQTVAFGRKALQIKRLKQQAAGVKSQLDQTQHRIESLSVESAAGDGRVEIMNDGERPVKPYRDNRLQLAGVGGLGGATVGVGLIVLLGFLDQRLDAPEDANRGGVGAVRLVGALPDLPVDLAEPGQAEEAAHAVHHLRTMLQVHINRRKKRVLAVTSPAAGDGKTSLCLALGFSFADSGARTLLIDCDVVGSGLTRQAHAFVHRRIGQVLKKRGLIDDEQLEQALHLSRSTGRRLGEVLTELDYLSPEELDAALDEQSHASVGLFEALAGEELDACTTLIGEGNLAVLPVGAAAPDQAGRLQPQQLQRLLARARKKFDVVLVDTGPISGSLEAAAVTTASDGSILVLARGARRHVAEKAMHQLQSLGVAVVGCVFNRADAQGFARYGSSSVGSLSRSRRGTSRAAPAPEAQEDQEDQTPGMGPLASVVHLGEQGGNGQASQRNGSRRSA